MLIASASNERVKEIKKLIKSSKERRQCGLYIVEGIRMVREIPAEMIHSIYISEDCQGKFDSVLAELQGISVNVVRSGIFSSMSDTGTPQGIMALVKMKGYTLEDIVKDTPFVLIIERLQDPGNLGTIIRTAEGAGVTGIILSNDSVDMYNPKVIRATMGSIFRMPVYVSDNIIEDINSLKKNGITIFGAHLKGTAFYEKNFKSACGFLIGNEGNGLSNGVSDMADDLLRIPMLGSVESLNAATSTAVIAYEVLRQRHFSS